MTADMIDVRLAWSAINEFNGSPTMRPARGRFARLPRAGDLIEIEGECVTVADVGFICNSDGSCRDVVVRLK